jgi:hypothetical protein
MAKPVPTTLGELGFQSYLEALQYPYEFEREFPGKRARPDYTVTENGSLFLFDVKDFDPYAPMGFMQFDSHPYIRERINKGRKKFKEFKGFPCAVVLQNNGNIHVRLEDPNIVLGSMYGKAGFTIPFYVGDGPPPVDPPKIEKGFIGGDGMMIRDGHYQNTTISALITLRQIAVGRRRLRNIWKEIPKLSVQEAIEVAEKRYPGFDPDEMQPGVIVWENAVARIPLARDLFTGPYDERWGVEGQDQRIVFRGEQLAEVSED